MGTLVVLGLIVVGALGADSLMIARRNPKFAAWMDKHLAALPVAKCGKAGKGAAAAAGDAVKASK
jgi:hypothetical protein